MRAPVAIILLSLVLTATVVPVPSAPLAAPADGPPADFDAALALVRGGDAPAAVAMFSDLAKGGHRAAQANLAVMLARGEGVPRDDQEAAYWAWRARLAAERRAAALADHVTDRLTDAALADLAARLEGDLRKMTRDGDRLALLGLGRIALQLRQPAQLEEALAWFSVAAALDVPGAAALRDAVSDGLPPEARLRVQARAREEFSLWCAAQRGAARPRSCPDP